MLYHDFKSKKSGCPGLFDLFFFLEISDQSQLTDYEKLVIETVVNQYGDGVRDRAAKLPPNLSSKAGMMTARAVFIGPEMIFGAITKRYRIGFLLEKTRLSHIMGRALTPRNTDIIATMNHCPKSITPSCAYGQRRCLCLPGI